MHKYFKNPIIRSIFRRLGVVHLGRWRTRDINDFIRSRDVDTVIDIGANVGQFGEELRGGGFRGKIISFEPIASVYKQLQEKAAADGNWEAHHCGLGTEPGAALINVSELTEFSSILDTKSNAKLHDPRTAVARTEEIEIRTLDQVSAGLKGNVFLKIDAQGYERNILEGGRRSLSRFLGIQLELPVIRVYEGEWKFYEALSYMADFGFVPAQILPVNYHTIDNVSVVDFDCIFRPVGRFDGLPSST